MKMKTLLGLSVVLFATALANAQVKPNVNKAQRALLEKKLAAAKTIIDATVASDEYMINKKGEPSKQAAKAWYTCGLVYASIDTSKDEKTRNLATNPFKTAQEAFTKAKEIDKDKTPSFISDPTTTLPLLKNQINANFAQAFINTSIDYYQKEEDDDTKKMENNVLAFENMEKSVYFLPNDTSLLLNAGVYMGPQAKKYEESLKYIKKYHENGGKNADAYIQKFIIYRDHLNDQEKALATAREMIKKYPNRKDFGKFELDIYLKLKHYEEALEIMKKDAQQNPKDKETRYYAGLVCLEMEDRKAEAQKWFKEAYEIDNSYFEAAAQLAQNQYDKIRELRNERNNLDANKKADADRRRELYLQIGNELEDALTWYKKLDKIKPNDESVLYGLLAIYSDLRRYSDKYSLEEKTLKAKMKVLGLEVD